MSLKAAVAIPRAWAATDGRDRLSEASSNPSPSPGSRSILARLARQPTNVRAAVFDARWPILSSTLVTDRPGESFSTKIVLIEPLGSSISDHLPNTNNRSATPPLVMKSFEPSITTSSPSGVNFVCMPVASEPAIASVMTSEPRPPARILGKSRCFCSSVPKSINGFMA